jgi:hypothetical protein
MAPKGAKMVYKQPRAAARAAVAEGGEAVPAAGGGACGSALAAVMAWGLPPLRPLARLLRRRRRGSLRFAFGLLLLPLARTWPSRRPRRLLGRGVSLSVKPATYACSDCPRKGATCESLFESVISVAAPAGEDVIMSVKPAMYVYSDCPRKGATCEDLFVSGISVAAPAGEDVTMSV